MRAAVVLTLLFLTGDALAWQSSGFRWRRLPMEYEVNTSSSQQLGQQATLQVVRASYTSWEAPNCSGYATNLTGETQGDYRSGDGMNTLVWYYDGWPRQFGGSSTIGITLSIFSGQDARDGDIVFNGVNHSWTTNPSRRGEVDAQSIITHETGHQLGLNHTPVQAATMYAAYLGGTGARTLDNDDITGVCELYPSNVEPDCRNDDDCPGEQICRFGACADPEAGGGEGAVGDPCGPDGECADGNFCVGRQGEDPFCTRQCGGGCPEGWACERVQFNNGRSADICLPEEEGSGGGAGVGEPCDGGQDCESGICLDDGRESYCSQFCQDDANCPEGAECVPLQGRADGACVPGEAPDPDMGSPQPDDGGVTPPDDGVDPNPNPDAQTGTVPTGGDAGFRPGPASDGGPTPILELVNDEDGGGCRAHPGAARPWWALALLLGIRRRQQKDHPPID